MATMFGNQGRYDQQPVSITDVLGQVVQCNTDASTAELQAAWITDALRDLLYQCMAVDFDQRPCLRHLVSVCQRRVYNFTENDYLGQLPGAAWIDETDEAVARLVQAFVLDADVREEALRLQFGHRGSEEQHARRNRPIRRPPPRPVSR